MFQWADPLHARLTGQVQPDDPLLGEPRLRPGRSLEPKTVTTGTPKAAAKCRGPVSLVTSSRARRISAFSGPRPSGGSTNTSIAAGPPPQAVGDVPFLRRQRRHHAGIVSFDQFVGQSRVALRRPALRLAVIRPGSARSGADRVGPAQAGIDSGLVGGRGGQFQPIVEIGAAEVSGQVVVVVQCRNRDEPARRPQWHQSVGQQPGPCVTGIANRRLAQPAWPPARTGTNSSAGRPSQTARGAIDGSRQDTHRATGHRQTWGVQASCPHSHGRDAMPPIPGGF